MSHEAIDVDEQFFAEELSAKRHKEQISSLKAIALLLNKPEKGDEAIVDAIEKQGKSLDKVAEAIQNLPAPEVKVVNDYKEIVSLLKENREGQKSIEKALIEQKQALENKPMVDEFKIQNSDNWSKTVKVIYKPANQITFKK